MVENCGIHFWEKDKYGNILTQNGQIWQHFWEKDKYGNILTQNGQIWQHFLVPLVKA